MKSIQQTTCGCFAILGLFLVLAGPVGIRAKSFDAKNQGDGLQRTTQGVIDFQLNSLSNVAVRVSNHGVLALHTQSKESEGYWPRGSDDHYFLGGGLWVGARKTVDGDTKNLVAMTYDPDAGISWCVPGRVEDGLAIDLQPAASENYRVYFSTDYRADGSALNEAEPHWPLWRDGSEWGGERFFGRYVLDQAQRNTASFSQGPVFQSDEQIFCVFKDTDLSFYQGADVDPVEAGYPLGLQFEQSVLSWASGDLRDVLMIRYAVRNVSDDILRDCWLAAVYDMDIALRANLRSGADDDYLRYYNEDPALNLALQWSAAGPSGYVGLSLLETPALDGEGFLRKDKNRYPLAEQLGLRTLQPWDHDAPPGNASERYDMLASASVDADSGPGDRVFVAGSGPFHLRPGDVATMVVAVMFARPAVQERPDGSQADLARLIALKNSVQTYYDNVATDIAETAPEALRLTIAMQPNPASQRVALTIHGAAHHSAQVELMDLTGRLLYAKTLPSSYSISKNLSIDCGRLPAGAYLCRVLAAGNSATARLCVVK